MAFGLHPHIVDYRGLRRLGNVLGDNREVDAGSRSARSKIGLSWELVRDAPVVRHLSRMEGCCPRQDWILLQYPQPTTEAFPIGGCEEILLSDRRRRGAIGVLCLSFIEGSAGK